MSSLRARTREAKFQAPIRPTHPAGQPSFDMPSIKDRSASGRPVASSLVPARLSFGKPRWIGHQGGCRRGALLVLDAGKCRDGVGASEGMASARRSSYAGKVSTMYGSYADCAVSARVSASPGIRPPAEKQHTNNIKTVGRTVGAIRTPLADSSHAKAAPPLAWEGAR